MTARRPARRGFTMIDLFVVLAVTVVFIGLLLPALQNSRDVARRVACQNNLLQISLALQNYAMAFDVLPPGTVNGTGPIVNKPTDGAYHVPWTVAILPYIERSNVYNRFDFRLSIYHRRNRPLRNNVTDVYVCPAGGGYAGCHAGKETPIDSDNDGCLFLNSAVRFEDVADGCANTIAVGESLGVGAVWGWNSGTRDTLRNTGAPPNLPNPLIVATANAVEDFSGQADAEASAMVGDDIDPAKAPPGLLAVGGFGSNHGGGAQLAFCDGSIRFVSQDMDRTVFRTLGSRNDGSLPSGF